MKKILICLTIMVILFGCTKKEDEVAYYNAYENIAKDDITYMISSGEILGDISNPAYVEQVSSDITLISILSIDGGDNFGEQTNEYCYPYTYGKFKVEKVYKGNLKESEEYSYLRAGGIINYQSYYNSLSKEEKSKNDFLTKGIKPAYIQMKFDGDIDIEPGKTYLAYLSSPESSFARKDTYMINSFQGGLREIKYDTTNIQVLNNFTGEWEYLDSIIE